MLNKWTGHRGVFRNPSTDGGHTWLEHDPRGMDQKLRTVLNARYDEYDGLVQSSSTERTRALHQLL